MIVSKNTDRDARIVEAWMQGASPKDLAAAHGVTAPRIYQIIYASIPAGSEYRIRSMKATGASDENAARG